MRAEARSAAMVVRGKVVDESELSRGTAEVREVVAALGSIHDSQYGWRMNPGDGDSQGAGAEVEDMLLVGPHAAVDKAVQVAWAREGG